MINNNRLIYSNEDLKILKRSIQKVKNLNFIDKKNKSKLKELNTTQKRVA